LKQKFAAHISWKKVFEKIQDAGRKLKNIVLIPVEETQWDECCTNNLSTILKNMKKEREIVLRKRASRVHSNLEFGLVRYSRIQSLLFTRKNHQASTYLIKATKNCNKIKFTISKNQNVTAVSNATFCLFWFN
jgi:hypothetical protein